MELEDLQKFVSRAQAAQQSINDLGAGIPGKPVEKRPEPTLPSSAQTINTEWSLYGLINGSSRVNIRAFQWWKNGDHPNDGPAREDPDVNGHAVERLSAWKTQVCDTDTCAACGYWWRQHGMVDWQHGGAISPQVVCPGSYIVRVAKTHMHRDRDMSYDMVMPSFVFATLYTYIGETWQP